MVYLWHKLDLTVYSRCLCYWLLVSLIEGALQASRSLSNQTFSNLLYENSTSFVQVSNFVSLSENRHFRLSSVQNSSAPGLGIKYVDMYQEYSTLEIRNESLVDSIGFRLGGISSHPMQLIITRKRVLVYNFTAKDNSSPMTLILVSNHSLQDIIGARYTIFMNIDGTTSSLQRNIGNMEFVISVTSSATDQSMLIPLNLECAGGITPQQCQITKRRELDMKPMYFTNIYNTSEFLRCIPSISSLDNIFNSSEVSSIKAAPNFLYFARFCKLSELSLTNQSQYSNTVEIYMLTSNHLAPYPIVLKTTINQINYSNRTYQTQVVDLIEFRGAVLLFNLNETYQIQPAQLNATSVAANAFTNNGQMTNLVACQQNDYNVVSCYLSLYDPKQQVLNNYLTEFANVQDNVIRIPPIALSYVNSGEVLGAINLNFIVFIDNQLSEDGDHDNKVYKMKIIQRGTEDILSNVTSTSRILLMKPMGPNFIMFRNTDIGMVFKYNSAISGFNASVYTMQTPFFRIDAQATNKSLPCFSYIAECQHVQFNLSYQPIEEVDGKSYQLIDFYHLNQNFTSVIPVDLNSTTMEVDITRDQVLLNITDSFHGVPHQLQVTNREYSPVSGLSNYNATTFYSTFDDLRINITGLDQMLFDYSAQKIRSAVPTVVRYSDGSIFVSIGYILDISDSKRIPVICQLPDTVDAGSDTDFTFSYTSLWCGSPVVIPQARPDIELIPIINSEIRGTMAYLMYAQDGTGVFMYVQLLFIENQQLLKCVTRELSGINQTILQTVRVFRSSSTTFDDCLTFWNDEEFNIVALDSTSNPTDGIFITGELLIKINIKTNHANWEWAHPNVTNIDSVTIADFNVVYLIYRYSPPLGSILQIHQCDFYSNTPRCYLYSWVQLEAAFTERYNPIVVDPITFNFARITNRFDMEIAYYDLGGFQNDFMHTVRKELKPSRRLSLKNILKSSFVEYFPVQDGTFVMNSVAGFNTLTADGKMKGCNLIIINLAAPTLLTRIDASPGLCSRDEVSFPTDIFNQAGTEPFNFPVLSRLELEQTIHYLIVANPSSGIILKNLRQLNSDYSDMYTTEVYQLVIESVPGAQFIQDFFGGTKYNFNFYVKPFNFKNQADLSIGSLLSGFTQNLSISCTGNQEGTSIIFRNSTVGLICPNQSYAGSNPNLTYVLNPFIRKEMDAILNNYNNPYLGSVVDYFVLSLDSSFIVALHDYISVLRLQEDLQFVANVYLRDSSTGFAVPLPQCFTINEGPIQGDTLEVEVICFNGTYALYSFTLNLTEMNDLADSDQPINLTQKADQYELSGSIASLYTSKSSQVMYLGDLYFSLNTIMIENYNDRGYLNIYNGAKTGKVIQPTLLWSSLSSDQFANCDLLIYKVTRLAQLIGVEQLSMFTIMKCDSGNLYTSFTNITTGAYPTFNTNESKEFLPAYPVDRVQLFWRNSTLFMFLLNQDLIQEYVSNDLSTFQATNIYRLSSVCDIMAELSIFRSGNYMFLYCYNSTSDSTMSDNMLVYNTQTNIQTQDGASFINPIQQLSFPDVDSPSNMILTSWSPPTDPSVVKLAISSTRSFVSTYSFRPNAFLDWQQFDQFKRDGYYDTYFPVLLGTQNILSSANIAVNFTIPLFAVILNYLNWFYQNLAACLVVGLYLVVTNVLVYTGITKERNQESQSAQMDTNFIHQYRRIMDNGGLKSFLLDESTASPINTSGNSMASTHMSMGLTQAHAGSEPRNSREQPFGLRTPNY